MYIYLNNSVQSLDDDLDLFICVYYPGLYGKPISRLDLDIVQEAFPSYILEGVAELLSSPLVNWKQFLYLKNYSLIIKTFPRNPTITVEVLYGFNRKMTDRKQIGAFSLSMEEFKDELQQRITGLVTEHWERVLTEAINEKAEVQSKTTLLIQEYEELLGEARVLRGGIKIKHKTQNNSRIIKKLNR